MSRRVYSQFQPPGSSTWFMFAYDQDDPSVLHIWARHRTTTEEAMATFFNGETTWNRERLRFETETTTNGLLWAWHQPSGDVLVISCFRKEEE